ncbi:histone-fold-containing protein [Aspergillus pseudotamarii]|uniref:DNA polymerase epsilon subunit D n=1 Tax=Aspergillus pseudotamarii TaxID=132259 RepID=A0A5N6SIE9_ASPPS|nr:histone-fold-containing protein [Aspergillus pseudotamarii]KAE8133163.1 histone-fold-containing protein [Aspergillus pseudotamarii]
MPPRKSTGETVEDPASSPQVQTQSPPTQSQPIQATEQQLKARAEGGVSIEDYLLPRSLTLRLAKSVLPPNTSIQKDAVLAIQKAATVFVSYLSSHANEATLKRTVAPSDVFSAISELEFDGFRSRLEKELDAFTELKAGKRKAKKGDAEATAAEGGKGSAVSEGGAAASRGVKRVKRVEGEEAASSRPEEGDDGDETQDEAEQVDEHEHEHESEAEEEEDEGEEEEEEEEEPGEEEDIDRVEDLDRDSRAKRVMDPDAAGDESDSEDDAGPSSQLRGDLGLG